jgi:hypothetical protein
MNVPMRIRTLPFDSPKGWPLTIKALPAGTCNLAGSGAASDILANGSVGATGAETATGAGTTCGATAITDGLVLQVAGGV